MVPALAVVLGAALPAMSRRWLLAQAALCAAIGLGAALAAPSLVMRRARPELPAELLAAAVPWGVAAAGALLAGAAIAVLAESRGRRGAAVAALAAGGLAFTQLGLAGHGQLAPVYSAYHSAARIKNLVTPDVPFYSVDTFDHSLLFYLGRTMTMVQYPDELGESIKWEPDKFIPDLATFEQRWLADRDAFAFLTPRDFAELERRGLPMTVVASDPRRVIVRKP